MIAGGSLRNAEPKVKEGFQENPMAGRKAWVALSTFAFLSPTGQLAHSSHAVKERTLEHKVKSRLHAASHKLLLPLGEDKLPQIILVIPIRGSLIDS